MTDPREAAQHPALEPMRLTDAQVAAAWAYLVRRNATDLGPMLFEPIVARAHPPSKARKR